MLNVGVCTALFSLLALWSVFGKARLHTRLLLAIPGLALFILLFHFGSAIERMMWRTSGGVNWMAFLEAYSLDELGSWLARNLPTVALAAPIMIGVLLLARESRWFGALPTEGSNGSALPRRVIAARCGLGMMFLIVLTPLVYLLYRLLTPPSLATAATLPSPNAFDDFVAAGNMTSLSITTAAQARSNRRAFEQLFRDLQPVADCVAKGLEKECLVPLDDVDDWGGIKYETSQAVDRAVAALYMRAEYYRQYGSAEQFVGEFLTLLALEQKAWRGSVAMMERLWSWDPVVISRLRSSIYRLNVQQLQDLAARLRELESSRDPFEERAARQLLYDQNTLWTRRLAIILDDWSGKAQYEAHREAEKRRTMRQRLLIADLAAQAFWLEHHQPPDSWHELVPDYLPAVPQDAFADAPLRLRRVGPRYVIYSTAIDNIDDLIRTRSYQDDQAVSGPYHPPLWIQLRDAAAIGLNKLKQRYKQQ
jgi:hypothetical protein